MIEEKILEAIIFRYSECELAVEQLKTEYFEDQKNRQLFSDMLKIREQGKNIDVVTLGETSSGDYAMDRVGFTCANVNEHVSLLKDKYFIRMAVKGLNKALKEHQKEDTPEDLKRKLEPIVSFLSQRTLDRGLRSMEQVSAESMEEMEQIMKGKLDGFRMHFKDFEKTYFRNGTLNIIAARPAMGKSSLALSIAANSDQPIALFSLEMKAPAQYQRMLSFKTGLTSDNLKTQSVLERNANQILEASSRINESNLKINDSTRMTVANIKSQCKRMKADSGLSLIIIDYVGLTASEGKAYGKKEHEVLAEISLGYLNIAKELDVPVVLLSQLNRDCEKRPDKRPMLSDLKSTGQLEQDAEMVLFIYRDEVYNEKGEPGLAEIIIAKDRNGPTGFKQLSFVKERTCFCDYDGIQGFRA